MLLVYREAGGRHLAKTVVIKRNADGSLDKSLEPDKLKKDFVEDLKAQRFSLPAELTFQHLAILYTTGDLDASVTRLDDLDIAVRYCNTRSFKVALVCYYVVACG